MKYSSTWICPGNSANLIKMRQRVRDERVVEFNSPSSQRFECSGVTQSACHWCVTFVRQQIMQTRWLRQHAALEQALSQLSAPRLSVSRPAKISSKCLKNFLKTARLEAERMSDGSEFHTAVPACEKTHCSNLVHRLSWCHALDVTSLYRCCGYISCVLMSFLLMCITVK